MAELSFIRNYLGALDSRPIKLPSDNTADPRSFPAQTPYILPKMPNNKRKRDAAPSNPDTPGTGISVTLKALKAQPYVLENQSENISVFDLKRDFAGHYSVPVEKVRVLKDKKPVTDSKIIRELLSSPDASSLELTVMLLSGATLTPPSDAKVAQASASTTIAATGELNLGQALAEPKVAAPDPVNEAGEVESREALRGKGHAELMTEEFWDDLRGFLVQRLRDEKEGVRVVSVFRNAVVSNGERP